MKLRHLFACFALMGLMVSCGGSSGVNCKDANSCTMYASSDATCKEGQTKVDECTASDYTNKCVTSGNLISGAFTAYYAYDDGGIVEALAKQGCSLAGGDLTSL